MIGPHEFLLVKNSKTFKFIFIHSHVDQIRLQVDVKKKITSFDKYRILGFPFFVWRPGFVSFMFRNSLLVWLWLHADRAP